MRFLMGLCGTTLAFAGGATAHAAKPGALDRSFGDGGKMVRHFCTHPRSGQVVIDRHGRIVFAGSNNNQNEFCVARYRRNGRPDRSFSVDGKVTTDIGGADSARSVAIDSRGRIVVAGATGPSEGLLNSVAVARYKPDGRLDTSFSGDGKATIPFGDRHDYARSVAIDSHDRIVVAGGSDHDFGLARFKWNGNLDGSFGAGGKVMTDFGGNDVAVSVAIDSQDRIVAAGDHPDDYFAVARYEPDGDLDGSFGDGGKVITGFGGSGHGSDPEGANAVAIDSRNRIVAAGGGFRLARYKPNGRLDPSFSGNGKVRNDWSADANSVAIDSRDRIVAMGWHSHLVLARFIGYRRQ